MFQANSRTIHLRFSRRSISALSHSPTWKPFAITLSRAIFPIGIPGRIMFAGCVAKFKGEPFGRMRPVPITPEDPFHWRHEEAEIILTCVRWYLDLPLSYRNVAKL